MNTHLDFDLDLAADQSDKNPVFYLQYAHARICNIIKRAGESDFEIGESFDPFHLSHPEELNLLKYMVRFPEFMDWPLKIWSPRTLQIISRNCLHDFTNFTANAELSQTTQIFPKPGWHWLML